MPFRTTPDYASLTGHLHITQHMQGYGEGLRATFAELRVITNYKSSPNTFAPHLRYLSKALVEVTRVYKDVFMIPVTDKKNIIKRKNSFENAPILLCSLEK